ncbi:MAG: NAD-binding protein [Acidobacteriota bacterium]
MTRSQRRLLMLIASLPLVLLVVTFVYMAGMIWLEGEPPGFWRALSWASETITTTGYGETGVWQHPLMVVFVILVQFFGVFLIYLVFPVYLIPFLEERFQVRLPREARDLEGHVVIYSHSPAIEGLLEDLEERGCPTLVIEEDQDQARRLQEAGRRVIHRDLQEDLFEAASLGSAKALVANASDEDNAGLILAARQSGCLTDVVALVEDPFYRRPIGLAGASAVYTPRHMLGAALAARASLKISPRISGFEQLGEHVEVSEVRVEERSSLAHRSLREANVGRRTGAIIIGRWETGHLAAVPPPETVMEPGAILVAIGSAESLQQLTELASCSRPLPHQGPFLVAGYGEVGRKVTELLKEVGEDVRVLDRVGAPGVDVVGDVLDVRDLEALEIRRAQAMILALDSDSATLFATVILKDLAPQVPIIARVNTQQNVDRIHQAGADFAISISQVTAQIVGRRLLGEEAVALSPEIRLRKVSARSMAGKSPSQLDLRRRTGCSVVAVEREGEVLVALEDDFVFREQDGIYVCGATEQVAQFRGST